jgi:hypothetical protein
LKEKFASKELSSEDLEKFALEKFNNVVFLLKQSDILKRLKTDDEEYLDSGYN